MSRVRRGVGGKRWARGRMEHTGPHRTASGGRRGARIVACTPTYRCLKFQFRQGEAPFLPMAFPNCG